MAETVRLALGLADQDVPVVIHGAAGTGKGLIARGMHYAGRRAQEAFVELDCSSLPEDVLAMELFGDGGSAHEGSSGILTLAGRGTALLRQIQSLSSTLQSRLATTMAQGLQARIVVSTKSPANDLLSGGTLVAELAQMLRGATLRVPSLTERERDLVLIANEVLLDFGLSRREPPKELAPETLDVLMSHTWPGNVRELIHVITAAAERCGGQVISPEDLVIRVRSRESDHAAQGQIIRIPAEGATLEWVTQEAVRITLEMTGGNKSQASRVLGISRPTLLKKLRSLEAREAREAAGASSEEGGPGAGDEADELLGGRLDTILIR